jgi:hypothetical protein
MNFVKGLNRSVDPEGESQWCSCTDFTNRWELYLNPNDSFFVILNPLGVPILNNQIITFTANILRLLSIKFI